MKEAAPPTIRDLCSTIARSLVLRDKATGAVVIAPEDVWSYSRGCIKQVIAWYMTALVKLKEEIPEETVEGLLLCVDEEKRQTYRQSFDAFNASMRKLVKVEHGIS
jgi:hypothetical protein